MTRKPARYWKNPFLIRLANWEYWSFGAVYIWMLPCWCRLAIRARSLFFFNACNPTIENGGMLNESKKDIHALMDPGLYPRTLHFSVPAHPASVAESLQAAGLPFPLMAKPDIGGKGRGIRKLLGPSDLEDYVAHSVLDFHLQEYVDLPCEAGIFYHRYPDASKGRVTGIVRKEFLHVVGDGRSTVRALLQQEPRGIIFLERSARLRDPRFDIVPEAGVRHLVSPVGNHARGTLFIDDSHLADERLNRRMDAIADGIRGFCYGRLDIRFRDWQSFLDGDAFSVIEVNGAGAEPAHMYDPRHGIRFAWREIARHWRIMLSVSRVNHLRGTPYLTFREGVRMFRLERELSRRLARMPE